MKRLWVMLVLVVSCLAFAATASANVFYDYPNQQLDVKFKGVEYALSSNGDVITDIAQLITSADSTMTGIFYVDSVQRADGKGNPYEEPPVYQPNGADVYIGVLSDLAVGTVSQLDANTFKIWFTGGAIDWYYSTDYTREDVIGATYDPATGTYVTPDGELDYASGEHFASYNLAYNDQYSGYAIVTISETGELIANFHAYGESVATADMEEWQAKYFDNDKYGNGYDISLDATLNWNSGDPYFKVNDPALLDTAATPEPGTFVLMSAGLLLTAFFIRRKQKGNA